MSEVYRCYFADQDGRGVSLPHVRASDPLAALKIAARRIPDLTGGTIEVWHNSDRVLTWTPAASPGSEGS